MPHKGCFIKSTRKKLVTIAGEVISHARSIEIRVMNYFFKEVETIRKRMNFVIVDANRLMSRKTYDSKT